MTYFAKREKIVILVAVALLFVPISASALNVDYPDIPIPGGSFNLNTAFEEGITLGELIVFFYAAALWIGGIVAFVSIVYAGFMFIFSGARPGMRERAKERLTNVLWGIAILLLATVALRIINPDITNLEEEQLGRIPESEIGADIGEFAGLEEGERGEEDEGGRTDDPDETEGGSLPPNLGSANSQGYYKMPDSTNNAYAFSPGTPPSQRCGKKNLISVIYTSAQKIYTTYRTTIRVGDLNATGHASHKNGIDVDLSSTDNSVANMNSGTYSREKTIAFGKALIDTGRISLVFYNDAAVRAALSAYAAQTGKSGRFQYWPNHEDHFHVRITDPKGPTSTSCAP